MAWRSQGVVVAMRSTRLVVLLSGAVLVAACAGGARERDSGSAGEGGSVVSRGVGGGGAEATGAGGEVGGSGGGPVVLGAALTSRTFVCKLIANASQEDPTANATQTRFNLTGADLGVPLASGDALLLFFGDTFGYKAIWSPGEDPDSVGRASLPDVARDPAALCGGLAFLVTPDDPSVAHGTDASVERDFAGGWMEPPPGDTIDHYIAQPAGPYPNMPGTFEVPTGALARDGKAYLFYAGLVETSPVTRATLGYLARWDAPGASLPSYQIVRPIDALEGGRLGGHFIQIAAVEHDGDVYLFGTGDYRRSGVHLARVAADALESGGEEVFDPASGLYRDPAALSPADREAIAPIFETDGVGELSVQRIAGADLFVALYQRQLADASGALVDNRVVARVARAPEGPWSDIVTIADMADPAFRARHCCGDTCPGDQILHCDRAGLYGAYLLPTARALATGDGGFDLTLPFVVSTWDPYDVVVFTAGVHVAPLLG